MGGGDDISSALPVRVPGRRKTLSGLQLRDLALFVLSIPSMFLVTLDVVGDRGEEHQTDCWALSQIASASGPAAPYPRSALVCRVERGCGVAACCSTSFSVLLAETVRRINPSGAGRTLKAVRIDHTNFINMLKSRVSSSHRGRTLQQCNQTRQAPQALLHYGVHPACTLKSQTRGTAYPPQERHRCCATVVYDGYCCIEPASRHQR